MEIQELVMTAARSLAIYVLMLVVIRLLGKRTIGNFTAFDLVVALMLGEVVDEIVYGDVTFLQGTIVIVVVAAAKYGTTWLTYANDTMRRLCEGEPTVLVERGKISQTGLRSEIMNQKELLAALRLQGIDDVREVKLAVLEVDGLVSVIQEEWAEPVQKADLSKSEDKVEKAPDSVRTDTKEALGLK